MDKEINSVLPLHPLPQPTSLGGPSLLVEPVSARAPDSPPKKPRERTKTSTNLGKPKKARKFGGKRGVESLFRNAYRAQLDLIALAATKANIMISLNGLLLSILVVSGAYLTRPDPKFLAPILIFSVTCCAAIVFAVLAARPKISTKLHTLEDFQCDRARLLIFEEFTDLSENQFVASMNTLLNDRGRLYNSMIRQIYDLGKTADQKFKRLYLSYTVFMIGIIISGTWIAALTSLQYFSPAP